MFCWLKPFYVELSECSTPIGLCHNLSFGSYTVQSLLIATLASKTQIWLFAQNFLGATQCIKVDRSPFRGRDGHGILALFPKLRLNHNDYPTPVPVHHNMQVTAHLASLIAITSTAVVAAPSGHRMLHSEKTGLWWSRTTGRGGRDRTSKVYCLDRCKGQP